LFLPNCLVFKHTQRLKFFGFYCQPYCFKRIHLWLIFEISFITELKTIYIKMKMELIHPVL